MIETVPISNGESREWLVVKFPFQNDKGERFVGGTAVDITERRAAIRQVASSESRYRELFECNPLPAWVYDRETLAFLTVNDAAIARYGWTREDFLSGMILLTMSSRRANCRNNANLPLPCRRSAAPGNAGTEHKDGLILSVDVTGYELDYEHRPACLMIVHDMTEKERMLEQLRVSEQRWQLALRGAGDALWDWDLTSDRVFRSPRWRAMLGYEESEIGDTREDFLRLIHPGNLAPLLPGIEAHLTRATPGFRQNFAFGTKMARGDGSWIEVRRYGTNEDGRCAWPDRRPISLNARWRRIFLRRRREQMP